MASGGQAKSLQDTLKGIFHWGSRYHAEKVGVIAAFIVLTVTTLVWAFSGPDDSNELGAEIFLRETMVGFDLVVENTGRSAWRDVRITLDRQYLYTADRIEGGDYVVLSAEDVNNAYYIPRPWGREDWEELGDLETKSGLHPDGAYEPEFVQIRARQGHLDIENLERRGD